MTNPRNNGTRSGRAAADVVAFTNKDNSHTLLFALYLDNNYASRDGEWKSEKIPFEVFVPASTDWTKTPYAMIREGDEISVIDKLTNADYRDPNTGQMVYAKGPRVVVEDISFHESKRVRDARAAEKAAKNGATPPAAQPAQAAQPVAPQAQVPQTQADIQAQIAALEAQIAAGGGQQAPQPATAGVNAGGFNDEPPF